jgi:hypothetical protein
VLDVDEDDEEGGARALRSVDLTGELVTPGVALQRAGQRIPIRKFQVRCRPVTVQRRLLPVKSRSCPVARSMHAIVYDGSRFRLIDDEH